MTFGQKVNTKTQIKELVKELETLGTKVCTLAFKKVLHRHDLKGCHSVIKSLL